MFGSTHCGVVVVVGDSVVVGAGVVVGACVVVGAFVVVGGALVVVNGPSARLYFCQGAPLQSHVIGLDPFT